MNWGMDWIWGLPLIILTVVIHAYGLALVNKKVASKFTSARRIHRDRKSTRLNSSHT